MKEKKNLIGLAKNSKKTTITNQNKKEATKTIIDNSMKAKHKVDELFNDIKPPNDANQDVITNQPKQQNKEGVDWLEEQLIQLGEESKSLRKELDAANTKLSSLNDSVFGYNSTVELGVIELFNELQLGYMSAGFNQHNQPNFYVNFPAFLNRMILFFPFLENHKKY